MVARFENAVKEPVWAALSVGLLRYQVRMLGCLCASPDFDLDESLGSVVLCVDCLDQPGHALVKTNLGHGTARLNVPRSVRDSVQIEVLHNLRRVQSHTYILLVREHKEGNSGKELFSEKLLKVILDFLHAHLVGGVNYINQSVSLIVVVAPVGSNLTLTADVPHVQLKTVLRLTP